MYDVETNTWSLLPPMKNNRGRFDITCVGGDVIYAVAGSNGQAEIASVEKYDPKVGKWTKSASLPVNLSNIGNKFGGERGDKNLVLPWFEHPTSLAYHWFLDSCGPCLSSSNLKLARNFHLLETEWDYPLLKTRMRLPFKPFKQKDLFYIQLQWGLEY